MFWDNPCDNTVDLSGTKYYAPYVNMHATNAQGYRCDTLTSSPIVFMGSCDMSGPIDDPEAVWSKIMHRELVETLGPFPYIALSRVHCGCHSVARRLYSYCKTYGPPKKVFIVLPRPVCVELPIRGKLVNVSERERYIGYLVHVGLLTPKEYGAALKAMEFARSMKDNPDYQLYQFEEFASMMQLICERYDIELRWTPNLAAPATDYFAKWLELFLDHNPYMRSTFAGVGEVLDFAVDSSTGLLTQQSLLKIMQSPEPELFRERLVHNLAVLKGAKEIDDQITAQEQL